MTVKEMVVKDKNSLVAKAYAFAQKAHAPQKRSSGEPYFNHVLAAAENVASWNLDDATIAAALLHDVVEDTSYTLEDIKKEFGDEVSFLVEGVTKLGKIKYRGVEVQTENMRKMILALSEDIRVVLVKLGDRLHNMQTLASLPPQKQKRIALETMEIYAPLAYRLGMQKVSGQLEDLAFPYLYPKEYKWLKDNMGVRYDERVRYIEKIKPIILDALQKNNVSAIDVEARAKTYASLYKKLLRYDMDIEKIHDLIAIRIIVPTVEACYAALGVIHKMWPPLPGRIKDYIALPKPNGYRSLHTTVFCDGNKITEIQIRTQEMHGESENGIAAHWAYAQVKGTKHYVERRAVTAEKKELTWVQQLRSWQKEFSNDEEFMTALKIDFFKDRIFAITPKGEVMDLPVGATPVDFAYQVHSQIGNSCVGARVNGKIAPLDYELRSGDMVEILTQKNKKPSQSWLEFVKTNMAKKHIKSAVQHTGSLAQIKKEPTYSEIKLVAEDRIGMLKDISAVIARSHISILNINVQPNAKFPLIKIQCDTPNKDKIEKLLLKLKSQKGIIEASYKIS